MDKKRNPEFDVTVGSIDGGQICELVGVYIFNEEIEGNRGQVCREMMV